MNIIEAMKNRYATKKFDAGKKISQEDLDTILDSINLSPTSYGLQLFKVYRVTDPELRKQLTPASWGQSQIEDASELLIFANRSSYDAADIDEYMDRISAERSVPKENLAGYGDFMKSKLSEMPDSHFDVWTSRQPYIALGNAMTVAATLGIDSCPIEGFESEKYSEILNLGDSGFKPVVVMALGYRSEEDATQHAPKVRRPISDLVQSF
jgi:nitroreductase